MNKYVFFATKRIKDIENKNSRKLSENLGDLINEF